MWIFGLLAIILAIAGLTLVTIGFCVDDRRNPTKRELLLMLGFGCIIFAKTLLIVAVG